MQYELPFLHLWKKSDLISYNPSFYPQDLKVELVNVLKEILGSLKACFSSQTFLTSPILHQETISTVITNTPSNLRWIQISKHWLSRCWGPNNETPAGQDSLGGVPNRAPQLSSCVTLGKVVDLSVPGISLLQNVANNGFQRNRTILRMKWVNSENARSNIIYLVRPLGEFNELIHIWQNSAWHRIHTQ